MNPNIRTEIVEVLISNTTTKEFSLGRLPNISEGKRIIKVEAFNATQQSFSPTGRAVVNAAVFIAGYLKLINNKSVELRTLPLTSISKINGSEIPELDLEPIDPEKSKVVLGSTASSVANEVVLFAFTFEK